MRKNLTFQLAVYIEQLLFYFHFIKTIFKTAVNRWVMLLGSLLEKSSGAREAMYFTSPALKVIKQSTENDHVLRTESVFLLSPRPQLLYHLLSV